MATDIIDEFTHRGHERFRSLTVLNCGDGKTRTFQQWLEWMKTWDPMREKGPGISKRPRPAKAKTTGGEK